MADTLLEVYNLKKYFTLGRKEILHAVDDVSFTINRGETVGIVGESGCGKSTLGRTILKLYKPTAGEIFFEGENITNYTVTQMMPLRKKMQIIFQDPYSSLNPKMTVVQIIGEALDISIQSQIINLLNDLQKEFNLSYLFISHDLSVVKHISDRIGVMYLGNMVEFTDFLIRTLYKIIKFTIVRI